MTPDKEQVVEPLSAEERPQPTGWSDEDLVVTEADLRAAWVRMDSVGDPRTAHSLWQHLSGTFDAARTASVAGLGEVCRFGAALEADSNPQETER